MEKFDPNAVGQQNGNYFGMPYQPDESALVLQSVPWDVTVSYGEGTRFGPDAIIEASTQIDFYDIHNPEGWQRGIGTIPIDYSIQDRCNILREDAARVITHLEEGGDTDDETILKKITRINQGSEILNGQIYVETTKWLEKDKIVGLVGGDHSTPYGHIKAISEKFGNVGILHIDAHMDLRKAYEGFTHSHASIMYNVATKLPQVVKIVQVGVRDYCQDEVDFAATDSRIHVWSDTLLCANTFDGMTWARQCDEIIKDLPQNVYISFDIDGLDASLCPHTGTPVAGGLSFRQAEYLLAKVAMSSRRIVGFDLCEVAPAILRNGDTNQWDANVGARVLYKLCMLSLLKK